ncbi:MAG TPA: sigma-70 family RNA polymerase sigma factor [Phycisphaerae bacterium]|nr:sigma-70 family RNA polymerase sigma factor [Phycisphaerae bacterium]HUU23286.1 sigma-70 family RNA polymerase sigma factor [Phycisphaerae bacterium]
MGDGLSRQEIFDRYFDTVYVYVAYLMIPDHEAARDVAQEVFLAALSGLESFRGDGSVLSWLRSIARNKVASHFRAVAARRGELSLPADELAHIAEARPDKEVSEGEKRALRIAEVMRSLPDVQAELLEEKYLHSATVRAMAERRGKTEEAIESALARARRAFRAAWQRRYGRALEESPGPQGSQAHERP